MAFLKSALLLRFLGTFKGWVTRKCITLGLVASAAATGWIAGKWTQVEQLASKWGFDSDALAQLHNLGGSLTTIVGGLITTLMLGIAEGGLSRAAAKVAEQAVIPKAIPVDQDQSE